MQPKYKLVHSYPHDMMDAWEGSRDTLESSKIHNKSKLPESITVTIFAKFCESMKVAKLDINEDDIGKEEAIINTIPPDEVPLDDPDHASDPTDPTNTPSKTGCIHRHSRTSSAVAPASADAASLTSDGASASTWSTALFSRFAT